MHIDLTHVHEAFAKSTRAERERYLLTPEQYLALDSDERNERLRTAPCWSPLHLFTAIAVQTDAPTILGAMTGDPPSNEDEFN